MGVKPGCGFFVAPGMIVTCAHVVGRGCQEGDTIPLRRRTSAGVESLPDATIHAIWPDEDVALLAYGTQSPAVAMLAEQVGHGHRLVTLGFPKEQDRDKFESVGVSFEGSSLALHETGRFSVEQKLKGGQVQPGFSGGPLLNLDTGWVIGMVVATRDRDSGLGGWAIPAGVITALLDTWGVALPTADAPWDDAPARQRQFASGDAVPTSAFHIIEEALSAHFHDPWGYLPALRAALESGDVATVVVRAALHGVGGVGKTQPALKYTLDYRESYAGVWWFRAESEATLELDALACGAAVDAHQRENEVPSAALQRWLDRAQGRWLLVYDNAEDVEALRAHLPAGRQHHVLITSRNPAWGGLARPFALDTWTPKQGADFLSDRLPQAPRAELLALAKDLGGLPLALDQARSYLDMTGMLVAEYRRLLDGVNIGSAVLEEGRTATSYERSVLATLSLAFERLSPAARQLLRICGFAAPEPIPERLFWSLRESRGSSKAYIKNVSEGNFPKKT